MTVFSPSSRVRKITTQQNYIYVRNYFCQGGEKTDVIMIVYRKNIIYIRAHLSIYSLLLIHSKIEYFTFAFVISKKKKIYKIYISLYF